MWQRIALRTGLHYGVFFYVFLPLHVRALGFFVFLKLVILLSALPYLPVEQAEQVLTAAMSQPPSQQQCKTHCVVW